MGRNILSARWTVALALLVMSAGALPARANEHIPDGTVVVAADGSIYLVQGGRRRLMQPALATEEDMAAFPEGDPIEEPLVPVSQQRVVETERVVERVVVATPGPRPAVLTPAASPARATPTRTPRPRTALIVTTQRVIRARGYSTAWLEGEVRNDGGEACGLTVLATFTDAAGVVVASQQEGVLSRRMPVGAVWPYEFTLQNLPDYRHLDVRATQSSPEYCPGVALAVAELKQEEVIGSYSKSFRATGMIVNDRDHPVTDVQVVAWFIDKDGLVVDVWGTDYWERPNIARLESGQSARFQVQSISSASNSWVPNITGVRAVAFGNKPSS